MNLEPVRALGSHQQALRDPAPQGQFAEERASPRCWGHNTERVRGSERERAREQVRESESERASELGPLSQMDTWQVTVQGRWEGDALGEP